MRADPLDPPALFFHGLECCLYLRAHLKRLDQLSLRSEAQVITSLSCVPDPRKTST